MNRDDETLQQLQRCCLNILLEIDRFCKERGIRYSLCGGSLIGAHLFDGFIPWDDDIDIVMTRDQYERFMSEYKPSNERFRLVNYRTLGEGHTMFAKLEDTHTVMVEQSFGGYVKTGAFVDITVVDPIPSRLFHAFTCLYGNYVYAHIFKAYGMVPGNPLKALIQKICIRRKSAAALARLCERYDSWCKKPRSHPYTQVAELLAANIWAIRLPASVFDQYTTTVFEENSISIVRDYMDLLYARYGKRTFTKEPPPGEAIRRHYVYFNPTVKKDDFDLDRYVKDTITDGR